MSEAPSTSAEVQVNNMEKGAGKGAQSEEDLRAGAGGHTGTDTGQRGALKATLQPMSAVRAQPA